jgi:bacteriorhodopsin
MIQATLLVGSACMGLSTLAFLQMAKEDSTKRFNYVALMVTAIAATAYCSMAFGLGVAEVNGRNVYYMRYIDWFFTTPLLLLDLAMLAGSDFWDTFYVIGMDCLMILAGALATFSTNGGKWPLFLIGMITFLLFLCKLFTSMSASAQKLGGPVYSKFMTVAGFSMAIWWVYPVLFVLCEGTSFLSEELEVLTYAIIDVIAKCGVGFLLLMNHDVLEATSKVTLLGK